ncbi:MAG: sigma factor, partial [Planctomycetota bacterium]
MDIEELLSHRPYVRALARSLVKDQARADDLVQQT